MNFNSNPNKEKLLEYPFGQYQRYRLASDLILQFKERHNLQKLRIIDVGASEEAHLKYFYQMMKFFF